MTQFTCKSVKQINNQISLNMTFTFTIRISRRFSSAREFQMGNFQKYWSQNVGQDFIVLDFVVGGRKRCVREINVSRAWDPVHAGDKALTRETPAKRGRVNRYGNIPSRKLPSYIISHLMRQIFHVWINCQHALKDKYCQVAWAEQILGLFSRILVRIFRN